MDSTQAERCTQCSRKLVWQVKSQVCCIACNLVYDQVLAHSALGVSRLHKAGMLIGMGARFMYSGLRTAVLGS